MAFAAKLVGVSRARIDPSTLSDLVVYADESVTTASSRSTRVPHLRARLHRHDP